MAASWISMAHLVFKSLSFEDCLNLRLVDKLFAEVSHEPTIWISYHEQCFGEVRCVENMSLENAFKIGFAGLISAETVAENALAVFIGTAKLLPQPFPKSFSQWSKCDFINQQVHSQNKYMGHSNKSPPHGLEYR